MRKVVKKNVKKAHAKALESARSLKTIGVLSTKQIAEILGLSEEEVEES